MFSLPVLALITYPFLFYPALIAVFILFAFLTEAAQQYILTGFLIVFVALGLQFFTDIQPFTYIMSHLMESFWVFGGWFLVGAIYATVKWWIYVSKAARDIKEYSLSNPTVPMGRIAETLGYGYNTKIPFLASDHKQKIIGWIIFWIFSLLGTFINDIIVEIANWLYGKIGNVLQLISDNAFKDIK